MLPENNNTISLNKYISDSGLCSRRKADELIKAGKITINGITASSGNRVSTEDTVLLDGEPIRHAVEPIYLAFYKPKKVVCAVDPNTRGNINDFLDAPHRLFPVLTIDKASEGLIFLTNDGDLANEIMQTSKKHEKEYNVSVNKKISPWFLHNMANGVELSNSITPQCFVEQTGHKSFRIILTHDHNRLIQRMCAQLNYKVVKLKRIRIMHVRIGKLPLGKYRRLTEAEIATLKRHLKGTLEKTAQQSNGQQNF